MKAITVVGTGIIGLTTAIQLQERGFKVNIIAEKQHEDTLSNKVGAIWFPFEVHPKDKANEWASLAYKKYRKEVQKNNGVSFIPFMIACNEESDTSWKERLPEEAVRKAKTEELPSGVKMAYIAEVPLAEPAQYLPHLFNRFVKNGGAFQERKIASLQELSALNDLVVNCTGLGARDLCNDQELKPMRGQILRCTKLNAISCVNSTNKGALSYIINRSTDSIIGGTDYINDWNKNVEERDTNLILQRLKASGLSNENPQILEAIVGLRPLRNEVRFEFDKEFGNVFHNYGHGGAGFTVAWGCASKLGVIFKSYE